MPRHTDRKPGWQQRKIKADRKKAQEQAAAKRGQAMTIGKGGITVKDGGTVQVKHPSGNRGVTLGPLLDEFATTPANQAKQIGAQMEMRREDGESIMFAVYRITPGLSTNFPDGYEVIQMSADDIYITGRKSTFLGDINENSILMDAVSGMILSSPNGVHINHSTTGASANCFIDPSDWRIWRSTSSQRYKQDIEDLAVDPDAVLRLRPRSWRDKAQVEQDAETETRYVGFIAEELHDVGLGAFVVYDDEDKPEAIAYDRLSAALVSLSQQQQRELDALKRQVGSLAERLSALESRQH